MQIATWREVGYMPKRIIPRKLRPLNPVEIKSAVIRSIEVFEQVTHEPVIEHGVPIPPRPIISKHLYPLAKLEPGEYYTFGNAINATRKLLGMVHSYARKFPQEFIDEGKQFIVSQNRIYRTS